MRHLLLFSAIIVGASWVALTPAMATSLAEPGLSGTKVTVTSVEKVGYWRRQYRMAILHPMPTIRRRTATIRLPSSTPTRQPFMATKWRRLPTPILRLRKARRRLHPLPVHRQKRNTATIRPLTETIQRRMASTAIIRRMDLSVPD